ncbi:MAG: peptidylprolyl isomerase [Candidatus Woesearchaeota archaeon]
MDVKKGNKVKIHYTGTLENGQVFDSSDGREPLEFEVGTGKVIKGFDEAIIGMKKDEEKEVKLKPEEAYGERNEELKQKVPKDKINLPGEIKPGMTLAVTAPDGQQFPVVVAGVEDENIIIDMNHPLAGQVLNFKIKLVDFE